MDQIGSEIRHMSKEQPGEKDKSVGDEQLWRINHFEGKTEREKSFEVRRGKKATRPKVQTKEFSLVGEKTKNSKEGGIMVGFTQASRRYVDVKRYNEF